MNKVFNVMTITAVGLAVCGMYGCSYAEGEKDSSAQVGKENSTALIGCRITEEHVQPVVDNTALSRSDYLPIVKDGSGLLGVIEIKQVEKVGISDWTNEAVVQAGVSHSYSIAMDVRLQDSLFEGDNLNLYVTPCLYSGGELIGEACSVGWTGFPSFAQLFDGNTERWIEVGLQPLVEELPDGSELVLKLSDASGGSYQDIHVSDVFTDVVEGPGLLTFKDKAQITSTNGAVFSITFGSLHCEKQPDSQNDLNKQSYYYTFQRKVKYISGPTNERSVSLFDQYNGNALNTDFVVGLQGDTDASILYDRNVNAVRRKWSDDTKYYSYVSSGLDTVRIGKTHKSNDNRVLPATTSYVPQYVRFRVEFPEEAMGMTNEELLSFSGRFVVFQDRITDRKLKESKK